MFDYDALDEMTLAGELLAVAAENLRTIDPTEMPDDHLCDEIVELQTLIDRLDSRVSDRIAEIDRRRSFRSDGYASTTAFLAHRLSMRASRAKRKVADARALTQMPETHRRLGEGELSPDAAQSLIAAHGAHPEEFIEVETGLCDAVGMVNRVEDAHTAIAYWRQAHDSADDDYRRYDRREFRASRTLDGMIDYSGRLDAVTGERFLAKIESALPPPAVDDRRTPAQRRADALVDLVLGDSPGSAKPQVMVHLSEQRLHRGRRGIGEVASTPITPARGREVACDAAIARIVMSPDSQPLDIGRSTRVVPEPMRRAVIARDRHCRFPGCDRPFRWCDAHHIVHWADDGPTNVDNLILLCRHHHTAVHADDGFGLSGSGQDPKFTRFDGTPLPTAVTVHPHRTLRGLGPPG